MPYAPYLMESKFKRELGELDKVLDFISDFTSALQVDESVRFSITLAVDELFTNMVKYHPESTGDILLGLHQDGNRLMITLIDSDVEPFDVTKAKEVNLDLPLEERQGGGLGIHLVKRMVDEISYEYENRQSKITLIKNLEK